MVVLPPNFRLTPSMTYEGSLNSHCFIPETRDISPRDLVFLSLLDFMPQHQQPSMVQDTGPFLGLPITDAPKCSGRYSPRDNGLPKQLQHHYPPCTTQASPPVMADDQVGAISGCRTPSYAPSPPRVETSVPEDIPHPPQSPPLGRATLQRGVAAGYQEDLMLEDQAHKQEYYSDDLQYRIKDMWPSQPSESDDCNREYGSFQKRVSETTSDRCASQPAHLETSQNDHDYEKLESHSQDWMADSRSLFQQPFPWDSLHPATQVSLSQSIHHQDRQELVDQDPSINASASYHPAMDNMTHSLHELNTNYLNFIPARTSYQEYTTNAENVPNNTLAPEINLSFYEAPVATRQDREDTVLMSEDIDAEYRDDAWWQDQFLGGSPSSMGAPESKVDEPYAQLIYRAFLSRPNKSMTLQEIYQWFRENTDKSKAEGKGWQNSIRHNLSMNGAFTKRNSRTPLSGNGDGSVSLDNTGVDSRKSTEWFLEPAFYAGVESTTRYRKGNSGNRSRGAGGHSGRSRPGSDGHNGASGGFSHARVSAGRKGGNVAAQNRKRLAERQQHARQMQMTRGHPQYLRDQGFNGPVTMPQGGFEDGEYYPPYPAPHLTPSPFLSGSGDVPVTTGQGQSARQMDTVYKCFNSDDVDRDVHVKRSRTLGIDNEPNEPVTPPGSTLDPPKSMDVTSKHRDFLSEMTGSCNPLNSYQVGLGQGQPQQSQYYTSADVAGDYEPRVGGHQPPIFLAEDISLSPDGALLMDLDFGK